MSEPGKVEEWRIGLSSAAEWARLSVSLGIIEADIFMSSRQARDFAIEVLSDQAAYLGFQPPNQNMRESTHAPSFEHGTQRRVRKRDRGMVDNLAREFAEMQNNVGDEVFAAALNQFFRFQETK